MDLRALFKEINELEATTNKAKKAENDANNENAFFRFEFLECVMRLSMQFQKSEDVKLTLQGCVGFEAWSLSPWLLANVRACWCCCQAS